MGAHDDEIALATRHVAQVAARRASAAEDLRSSRGWDGGGATEGANSLHDLRNISDANFGVCSKALLSCGTPRSP